METKDEQQTKKEVDIKNSYRCDNKKYFISFYVNDEEKIERFGCYKSVLGIIENFTTNDKVAIRDNDDNLWWISSKLIMVMRPMNEFELKSFEKTIN